MNKWDQRLLTFAAHVSTWSKDPSTRCGAVIADRQRRILSIGFNGLPGGVLDTDERLNDRSIKYQIIIHAEQNALLFCRENDLSGATIYTSPMPPCAHCAALIIQRGIRRIVTCAPAGECVQRWAKDWVLARQLYDEAGVELLEWTEDV